MTPVPPSTPGQEADEHPQRPVVGRLARAYAFVAVSLRYPILFGWIAAALLAVIFVPSLTTSGGVGGLVPPGSAAVRAERDAARLFGAPLDASVAVVQEDPHGLPPAAQVKAAHSAVSVDLGRARPIAGLAGAFPIANTAGLFPGSRARSTTVITFLYFRPGTSLATQTEGGQAYARRYASAPGDHLKGVTGLAPAQYEQGQIISHYLPWVEVATLVAIALIVGWHFRAVGAPLATLLSAAVAYVLALRLVAWTAHRLGLVLPPDLKPVLIVLLLGVTTDYSVFFLSGMRVQLAGGAPRLGAARRTTAENGPIILTAGLVVAVGTASLAVARVQLLRAFGPGLALTVLAAMAVSLTLTPALIAIFGGLLFRPGPAWLRRAGLDREGAGDATLARRRVLPLAGRLFKQATARPVALLLVLVCSAGLLAGAWGILGLRLGSPIIRELPSSSEAPHAAAAASRGFVPGIMAPTDILVLGRGVTGQTRALDRLQHILARQPGVAGVVGPADLPRRVPSAHPFLANSGNAARYGVIEGTDPLGPVAVTRVRALQQALPSLARSAGLIGVRFEVGGPTALTAESIHATDANILRVALAMLVVTLVLLAVFLRSLLAPLYLLAASILALLATLGLSVWVFHGLLGYSTVVYYVPFAVAVLLVSLGSDYNIFVVGRIWEEARRRPLRDAIAIAAPRASRAITTAGLALAASFALLALIPLEQFRELAVAMALGVILDSLVVRSLLVPALVAVFGQVGRWPAGRRRAERSLEGDPCQQPAPGR